MKPLGFITALLLIAAFSSSFLVAGAALAPLVAPFCQTASRLWPPFSVPRHPLVLKLVLAVVFDLLPALVVFCVLRLEPVVKCLSVWSWAVRLTYIWSTAAVFVVIADSSARGPRGSLSEVLFAYAVWVLPASMFYDAFHRAEFERKRLPDWVESAAEVDWRYRCLCSIWDALTQILSYLFERGRNNQPEGDVFGASAAVSARDSGL